jgi:hypothetical protein
MEHSALTTPAAVWLYGSHARGDSDSKSDVDILVVADMESWKAQISRHVGCFGKASVSRYSWAELQSMANQGSLFLQHLRMEGISLFESPESRGALARLLNGMSNYKHARRDVMAFDVVLKDVNEELLAGSPIEYELSVLGTVLRHASILGCHLINKPCFGRIEPVQIFSNALGLPAAIGREFPLLYEFRLASERQHRGNSTPNRGFARKWLARTQAVVDQVGELT